MILFTFHLERCLRPSGGQSFLAKDFVVTEKAEGIEGEWEVCRVQIGEGLFQASIKVGSRTIDVIQQVEEGKVEVIKHLHVHVEERDGHAQCVEVYKRAWVRNRLLVGVLNIVHSTFSHHASKH